MAADSLPPPELRIMLPPAPSAFTSRFTPVVFAASRLTDLQVTDPV